ncbi:MAG TPA: hypothetical protein VHY37_12735 [Tepidisphaeraceae bacterium]|jgi:hypothetical protein|nr:hypothetical protein [Tepidisphaeraceae bacterium]
MWGNRLGWIISGAMAAVFGWVLVMGAMPAGIESATGALAAVGMQVPALPIDPLTVFKPGATNRDAGPLYREAMHDYDENPDRYTDMEKDPAAAFTHPPVGVQKIVKARDCNHMNLFAKDPTELINYENKTPGINALQAIGTLTDQLAFYAAKKHNFATARKYAEALFALGYHLANERVRFSEWSQGVGFMQSAALDLALADPTRAKAYQDFDDSSKKYVSDTILPFWQDLDGVEPTATNNFGTTESFAGDFYQLSQNNNPEHMWRVEAILRLGRLTHDAPTRGDQLVARHFLTKLAGDPTQDPQVHAAAIAARDIITNNAEYNRIGGSTE